MAKVKKKLHQCTFQGCKKTFTRPGRLEQHLRTHTGERPYVCRFQGCEKSYTRSQHLTRHLEVSHGGSPDISDQVSHTCQHCSQNYASKDSLKKHQKQVHGNDKPYNCSMDGCNESFKKRHQLRAHLYSHKGVLPFQCHVEGCRKQYSQSSHLQRHLERHETGYPCTYPNCDLIFSKMSLLRKHKSFHHRKVFKCEFCVKSFTRPSTLAEHQLREHSEKKKKSKCPHCERSYFDTKNLKSHIQRDHKGFKFNCDKCDSVFSTKQKLERHVVNHDVKKSVTPKSTPRKRDKFAAQRLIKYITGERKLKGSNNNIEGSNENVKGSKDNIEGSDDNFEGSNDNIDGSKDNVEGSNSNVESSQATQTVNRKYETETKGSNAHLIKSGTIEVTTNDNKMDSEIKCEEECGNTTLENISESTNISGTISNSDSGSCTAVIDTQNKTGDLNALDASSFATKININRVPSTTQSMARTGEKNSEVADIDSERNHCYYSNDIIMTDSSTSESIEKNHTEYVIQNNQCKNSDEQEILFRSSEFMSTDGCNDIKSPSDETSDIYSVNTTKNPSVIWDSISADDIAEYEEFLNELKPINTQRKVNGSTGSCPSNESCERINLDVEGNKFRD